MRLLAAATVSIGLLAGTARAFVWPSVPAEIARALDGNDVAERRLAAERLAGLPAEMASPLVLKALGDADVDVRLRAARSAARLGLASASDAVVPWLSESDAKVRLAACELVRRAPTAKSIAALGRVLGDPDATVRLTAAAAMGAAARPESVTPLLGHLDDPNPQVRVEVVLALARIGDPRAVFPLIGKVGDSAPEVRKAVARALGDLGDARATSALVLALRDNAPEVRVEALTALGRLGADEAALAIAPVLEERTVPEVRRAAVAALGRIGSERAVETLVAALATDDPTANASPVRDALAAEGTRAVAALEAALAAPPSPTVAAGAALTLGAMGAKGATGAIVDAMRRGSLAPEPALRALGRLGDPAAVPAVLELLTDARPFVRRQADETLLALLDPAHPDGRGIEPIAAVLRDPRTPPEERETLARALGRTGSPRALDTLVPLVEAKSLALRLAAIDALGVVGPAGQDAALLGALSDENAAVRLQAAVALSRAAGEGSVGALLDRLAVAAEEDRGAVGIAVAGAMARAKEPKWAEKGERLLATSSDAARDALLEGLGRMPGRPAGDVLARAAKAADADDRRKVAESLAGHPEELVTAIALLGDGDAAVRAAAAWSVGTIAHASAAVAPLDRLAALAADSDADVAANAVASVARIAVRGSGGPSAAALGLLCRALDDGRPYVRTNALAGLALVGARCDDGAKERALLARDGSEVVRGAAAELLHRVPARDGAEDRRALSRCAEEDKTASVAARCGAPASRAAGASPLVVFVVPDGRTTPVSRAPFALLRADGLVRGGLADRRGAVFESSAPTGAVTLLVPGPLAR